MARSVKTSGPATALQLLIAVDDDNATIKEFVHGVSLTNTSISVNTSKTWKGVSVPMIELLGATSKIVLGGTTPNIVSPACIFVVAKASAAQDSIVMVYGSATAGGSPTTTDDPFMTFGSNPSPVLRASLAGNLIALPSITLAGGESWSCFWNSDTAWPNVSYMALEANTLSGSAPSFSWNPGGSVDTLNGFLKQIGTNGSPSWDVDIVMIGVLSGTISQADAAAIHADPFGTLFAAGGMTVNPGAGTMAITGPAPTVTQTGGTTGHLTTSPLKNNTATVQATRTGLAVSVLSTAGALVVAKTAQATDGSGVLAVSDALIIPGTQYHLAIVDPSNGAAGITNRLIAT